MPYFSLVVLLWGESRAPADSLRDHLQCCLGGVEPSHGVSVASDVGAEGHLRRARSRSLRRRSGGVLVAVPDEASGAALRWKAASDGAHVRGGCAILGQGVRVTFCRAGPVVLVRPLRRSPVFQRGSRGHLPFGRFRCGRSCCKSPVTAPAAATPVNSPSFCHSSCDGYFCRGSSCRGGAYCSCSCRGSSCRGSSCPVATRQHYKVVSEGHSLRPPSPSHLLSYPAGRKVGSDEDKCRWGGAVWHALLLVWSSAELLRVVLR